MKVDAVRIRGLLMISQENVDFFSAWNIITVEGSRLIVSCRNSDARGHLQLYRRDPFSLKVKVRGVAVGPSFGLLSIHGSASFSTGFSFVADGVPNALTLDA